MKKSTSVDFFILRRIHLYVVINMVFKFKKWQVYAVVLVISLLLAVLTVNAVRSPVIKNMPVSQKVIVVDAGHGGLDGGATSKDGFLEKNINLSIAKYLKEYLEQSGAKVIMTRSDDVSLHKNDSDTVKNKKRSDLIARRNLANSSGGDAFISIHINYFQQSKYKGAQVFYETKNSSSITLAECIQKEMIDILDKNNNRTIAKIASNKILYQDLKIPSVLVECGFLSNPDEAKLLSTKEYQKKTAYSIYMGILDYFAN